MTDNQRHGFVNTPIGHSSFQAVFNHALKKCLNIANKYEIGISKRTKKMLYGHYYPISKLRKAIITMYANAGLSTAQIQTYSTHTSAHMVDLYVQQSQIRRQRVKNDEIIRQYIEGDNYRAINQYDDVKDDEYLQLGFNNETECVRFTLSNDFSEEYDTITNAPTLSAYTG